MGASRTSNKDILDAINSKTDAIATLAAAIAGTQPSAQVTPEPVVTAEPEATERDLPSTVSVKPEYLAHQKSKAQAHADAKGETVILYGRVNLAGEHKLAYCLGSRWTSLRDKGLVGAVATFDPAS